jgi:hypothetical protein
MRGSLPPQRVYHADIVGVPALVRRQRIIGSQILIGYVHMLGHKCIQNTCGASRVNDTTAPEAANE